MKIKFKVNADCIVENADHGATVKDIQRVLTELMNEAGITAMVTVTEYQCEGDNNDY